MAFIVSPLVVTTKRNQSSQWARGIVGFGTLLLACIAFVAYSSSTQKVTSLDEEGMIDDKVYAPAYGSTAAANPLYPPPPTQAPGDNGDMTGTGAGAGGAEAVAADPTTAASGQDFTVADYDKLKFERREALDFCEAHFTAFVNIQKCIYELFKNARY